MKQVVFVEWSSRGRDFEIDLPLMYFFEKVLKWEVKYISIFNLQKILLSSPDIVIMSNTIGADINLQMARIIGQSNIPFFSHVSEGMFREKDIEEFVWGWGKQEKFFSEQLSMLWSSKSYKMSIRAFPYTQKTYRVSGAVGFDKYKLYNFNKIDVKSYKKIIGYACFDFHNIFDKKDDYKSLKDKKWFREFSKLPNKINATLINLIQNNTDIMFLFKAHPGDGDRIPMELSGLLDYNNTLLIDKNISITDAISNSDIWLNYNSSTNLEAWLLHKPTISFNIDENTYSSNVLYGSLICDEIKKIQKYINEFYQNGTIKKFEEKKGIREKLISEYIGFSDGLNHVRFMSFLKPYIEKIEKNEIKKREWNIPLKQKIIGYIKHVVYTFSKGRYNMLYIKKWARIYDMFSDKEVENQKRLRYPGFDKFYDKNKQQIDDIYNSYARNWKKELKVE